MSNLKVKYCKFLFRKNIHYITLVLSFIINNFAIEAQDFKIFHCMVDLTSENAPIMKKYGIEEATLIDGRYIDPKKSGKIDSAFLTKSIINFFPNDSSRGMGLLDLEDKNFNVLRKGTNDPYFDEGLGEMIKMIRIAKNLRPNVTWSIYNIPYSSYWEKNDLWNSQETRLKPLLCYVDILTPALYDFYPDSTKFSDDKSYYDDNLNLFLSIGKNLNKEVMPYIWHRWHEGNSVNGLLLIDLPEFKKNLLQIIKIQNNKTKISGLIWFDAQSFFYKIKDDLKTKDAQRLNINKEETITKVIDVYGKVIHETLISRRKCKRNR